MTPYKLLALCGCLQLLVVNEGLYTPRVLQRLRAIYATTKAVTGVIYQRNKAAG